MGPQRPGTEARWGQGPMAGGPAPSQRTSEEKAQHRPAAPPPGQEMGPEKWRPVSKQSEGGEPEEQASAAWGAGGGGEPRAPNCPSSPGHDSHTSPPSAAAGGGVGSLKARMRLSGQRSGESELGWAPGPSKNNPLPLTPRSGAFHTQAAVGLRGASQWGPPHTRQGLALRGISLPRWGPERWLQRSLRTPGIGTVPPIP